MTAPNCSGWKSSPLTAVCFSSPFFGSGYVSFVRSYAAFPKDVRDIFNFQNVHLGHYAKSFALRDPPARINSAGRLGRRNDRTEQFRTARQRNSGKRANLTASAPTTTTATDPADPSRRYLSSYIVALSTFKSRFVVGPLPPPSLILTWSSQRVNEDETRFSSLPGS